MQTESITVHATYDDIRRPSELLRRLFNSNRVSEEITNGCELALHELLTNLVDHSYEADGSQLILVKVTCSQAWILLETRDTGAPMTLELDQVRMPEPSELAEGGYGVAIIRTLMDEVKYGFENGTNIWQLKKYV